MTPKEGARFLLKLLGKKAAWRVNDKACTADERAEAVAALPELRARELAAKQARDARYRAVLAADGEYQARLAEWKVAQVEHETMSSRLRSYRITVGLNEGWCFSVRAQGDNWADVIRKLKGELDTAKIKAASAEPWPNTHADAEVADGRSR